MIATTLVDNLKSRNGALAAAGTVAVVVVLVLIAPVLALFRAQEADMAASLHQLAVLRAQAATAPAVNAQLAELQRRMAALPGSIQAKTTALGQSQLQQTLESVVSAGGGSIRSAQILPPVKANGFETLAIQYDVAVPMHKLQDLAYAIETHVPYLLVDSVQMSGGQGPQAANGASQDLSLEVRLTVRAYRWGDFR
jgi:hypothetical protein